MIGVASVGNGCDASNGSVAWSRWRISLCFYLTDGRHVLWHCRVIAADQIDSYRTPLERVLGMRLVYATRQTSRAVSFEFLNRQLVWHAFTVGLRHRFRYTRAIY